MVMAPEVQFDFGIELSDLDYPDIHVHIASNKHLNFGGLGGHGDLKTASEVTSDLKIQLSDLDYLCSHVSLASKGLHELNCNRGGGLPSIDERSAKALTRKKDTVLSAQQP